MATATVVIQVGNSDDKLSQAQWFNFVRDLRQAIVARVDCVHFSGGSDWDAAWQNACWVCAIHEADIEGLQEAVAGCRARYDQDSAAFTVGQTTLV